MQGINVDNLPVVHTTAENVRGQMLPSGRRVCAGSCLYFILLPAMCTGNNHQIFQKQ
jgi:hypothetical protein